MKAVEPFQMPTLRRSLGQFALTLGGFVVLDAAMYVSLRVSVLLTFALALPTAGMMVRLFIIQHDCGHGAFFRSRSLNDWLGRCCAPFTFTPYAFWKRQHAHHHASFNNLDRRDSGLDLYSNCATLAEYEAMPRRQRLIYRLSRHPFVTQALLPPIVFLLLYRVPFDTPRTWIRERASVWLTNATIAAMLGALMLTLGIGPVLFVQVPIVLVASIVGVWLFSVQHRFEAALWSRQEAWQPMRASLEGSSYLRLPRVLQWFTGNIGFHHVHHLSSRVPNYRLEACHAAHPALGGVTTLGLREALRAPGYALWDERLSRMVRFPA